jgi:multidrug efflux pump
MRNTVILVDQIDQDEKSGFDTWRAIVESTVRRFRPIMLTASAAVLAMVPLARSDFFGPQAITILGGLLIATVLTIVFVPALYAAWFGVQRADASGSERATLADRSPLPDTGRLRTLVSAFARRLSWKYPAS